MPSTSGRTQTYPRATDKIPFFVELKTLREEVKRKNADTCIGKQWKIGTKKIQLQLDPANSNLNPFPMDWSPGFVFLFLFLVV